MCIQNKNQFGASLSSVTPVVNRFLFIYLFTVKQNNVVGNENYGSTKIICVYQID